MGSKTTWVATFDGAEARVFTRDRETGYLQALETEGLSGPHRPDIERERTITYARVGPGRSAVEPAVTPEMMLESTFIQKVADQLADRAQKGAFDRLIVAAGPRALGMFRKHASEPLKDKIVVEVDKDHVHTPVKQLEQALSGHF
ncbi:host attachment protein [Caulobacter sp. 17J80-11]|uniref:host attachment protein n=1 Tax=Caulobacter sp. 17J80-11 TaxID=2763502 RepID=UPI00165392BC|nr:host attachment protein [Caulobacter sp. 17J80-11]MBC6983111.1 host attachment protein [Caulobacter sp. 17J80-11]